MPQRRAIPFFGIAEEAVEMKRRTATTAEATWQPKTGGGRKYDAQLLSHSP